MTPVRASRVGYLGRAPPLAPARAAPRAEGPLLVCRVGPATTAAAPIRHPRPVRRRHPIMEPEQLLDHIRSFAQAYAERHTVTPLVHLADDQGQRANLQARAEFWNVQVREGWDKLTVGVNSALPPTLYAAVDPRAPVATPNGRQVEARGSL